MKKYTSRIGPELAIPVAASMGIITYLSIINSEWALIVVPVFFSAYFLYLYFSTNYTIQNNALQIKCGFFFNEIVDIKKITEVKKVTDIFSTPAFSINRILIKCPEAEGIAISPKNEKKFIADLLAVNPEIKVDSRNSKFNLPSS